MAGGDRPVARLMVIGVRQDLKTFGSPDGAIGGHFSARRNSVNGLTPDARTSRRRTNPAGEAEMRNDLKLARTAVFLGSFLCAALPQGRISPT
jgi:hypothetical protein